MDDLELTTEFKEAAAAISRDIERNPQRYKQVGEWLDQYYDKDFCQHKMQKWSESLLDEVFVNGINRNEYYCPKWHISGLPTIRAYEVLQAVAMDEVNYFVSMQDLLKGNDLLMLPAGSLRYQQAKDIVLARFKSKTYAALKDRLWLACKEILEIKKQAKFMGREESVRVCLLTWLLADPDTDKAASGITNFANWQWYSSYESGVCPQRADVISLLETCDMLKGWQNLTCEAWQKVKHVNNDLKQKVDLAVGIKKKKTNKSKEQEKKYRSWKNQGDACFIIENNRIQFHHEGVIKDLRLKSGSRTDLLLKWLQAGPSTSQAIKEGLCSSRTRPSDLRSFANEILNKKIAALGFVDVGQYVEFIKYNKPTNDFQSALPIYGSRSEFDQQELSQPMIDDRRFKRLEEQ